MHTATQMLSQQMPQHSQIRLAVSSVQVCLVMKFTLKSPSTKGRHNYFLIGNPDPISVPGSSPSQHGGKEKQSQDEKIKLGREVGELYNSFSLDCCNEHVCVNAIVCIEQPQMQVSPYSIPLKLP